MTTFLQLHLLTVYPPANLNRDDTGRPKTAIFGNVPRLRISSQALKRAWRESDVFAHHLEGRLGKRTQRLGEVIERHLRAKDVPEEQARRAARDVAGLFGKLKGENDRKPTFIEQLAFVSPEEQEEALALAERVADGQALTEEKGKETIFREADSAVDIAMFGRMLAAAPAFNREAAVQVAHAITTHRADVEDDYYTAVDDLKTPAEDAGAGFVGEAGFGAGVFYLYACIDRDLLLRNLDGDDALAATGIGALIEAAATVSPKGKQASFASRARAGLVMVERGETAPRTLAAAFARPVTGEDIMQRSIAQLHDLRTKFARAYGDETEAASMNVAAEEGSLAEIVAFARS